MRKSGKSIQNKGRKGESGYIYFIIYFFFFDGIEKKKFILNEGRWKLEEKKRKERRAARRGNKWSGGRGESLGCNLFCSELGKGKVDICIYNLFYNLRWERLGNEKEKIYFKQGRWKLKEKKKNRNRGQLEEAAWMKVEPSVVVRGNGREQKGSGVGEAVEK